MHNLKRNQDVVGDEMFREDNALVLCDNLGEHSLEPIGEDFCYELVCDVAYANQPKLSHFSGGIFLLNKSNVS